MRASTSSSPTASSTCRPTRPRSSARCSASSCPAGAWASPTSSRRTISRRRSARSGAATSAASPAPCRGGSTSTGSRRRGSSTRTSGSPTRWPTACTARSSAPPSRRPAQATGGRRAAGSREARASPRIARVADLFGQGGYDVRFEWGLAGARAVRADAAVVVDVLSFSTAVTIAVERGMTVFPYRWEDDGAEAYAVERDAVLAVGRGEELRLDGRPAPSLSPAALRACRPVERLVLPSRNGSTIAAELQEHGGRVAVGCLRNATATARWLAQALDAGRSVAVIAAGERWAQDGSLRPALEDHLAAGEILSGVIGRGHGERMSPEGQIGRAHV